MSVLPSSQMLQQLLAGHCADPFSILGMHQTSKGLVVRALLPDATSVQVLDRKTTRMVAQLDLIDERGFLRACCLAVKIRLIICSTSHGTIINKLLKTPTVLAPYSAKSIIGCSPKVNIYVPMKV